MRKECFSVFFLGGVVRGTRYSRIYFTTGTEPRLNAISTEPGTPAGRNRNLAEPLNSSLRHHSLDLLLDLLRPFESSNITMRSFALAAAALCLSPAALAQRAPVELPADEAGPCPGNHLLSLTGTEVL